MEEVWQLASAHTEPRDSGLKSMLTENEHSPNNFIGISDNDLDEEEEQEVEETENIKNGDASDVEMQETT
jgi:hypothetical protein